MKDHLNEQFMSTHPGLPINEPDNSHRYSQQRGPRKNQVNNPVYTDYSDYSGYNNEFNEYSDQSHMYPVHSVPPQLQNVYKSQTMNNRAHPHASSSFMPPHSDFVPPHQQQQQAFKKHAQPPQPVNHNYTNRSNLMQDTQQKQQQVPHVNGMHNKPNTRPITRHNEFTQPQAYTLNPNAPNFRESDNSSFSQRSNHKNNFHNYQQ